MSLYERCILPRVLDSVMRSKELTRYRAEFVPQAHGTVLEMGIGSGLNLPFYGPQVQRLYAIDPSESLLRMARKRALSMQFPVEFFLCAGEALPIDDHCVDTILSTFTLCTIADPLAALGEMRRVLKSSGQLLFAEHGFAPDRSVQRWQHYCNPLWSRIAGGCNLNRKMDELIGAAGFRFTKLTVEYSKGLRLVSYIYAGSAHSI